jgi:hypothetical protein
LHNPIDLGTGRGGFFVFCLGLNSPLQKPKAPPGGFFLTPAALYTVGWFC